MNISGVNHTGTQRRATTERIVEAKNATTIHLTVCLIFVKMVFNVGNISLRLLVCQPDLLQRAGLGLLNHLLRGIHIYLDTTVLCLSGSRRVVGYGIGLAKALDTLDLSGGNGEA